MAREVGGYCHNCLVVMVGNEVKNPVTAFSSIYKAGEKREA